MNHLHARTIAFALLGIAAESAVGAQAGPAATALRPPLAVLNEPFGRVGGVRELADGTVLVGDGAEKRIVVADFRTQSRRQIGRNGNGPGEYSGVGPLHALGTDTTLATDAQARRWLLIEGSRIVKTIPSDDPAMIGTRGVVFGTDRFGHILASGGELPTSGTKEMGLGDSALVYLTSLWNGRADTVAKFRRVQLTYIVFGEAGGRPLRALARPAFFIGEDVALAEDGWLAIVRLDPYRVDWRAPDGRVVRGSAIPYSKVRVSDKEKDFYLQRNARARASTPNLPAELSAAQRATALAAMQRQWTDFPDFVPPYAQPSITATGAGVAFLLRTPTAEVPNPVYDVINRRGQLAARLQLAKGERIIATGRGCIYVAAEDEDGLDHLRRHPWP